MDYNRVWSAMNDLEAISTKLHTIKDLNDSLIDAAENGDFCKVQRLAEAIKSYSDYVLEQYDLTFATAWNETVTKLHEEEFADVTISDNPRFYDGDDDTEDSKKEWQKFWDSL